MYVEDVELEEPRFREGENCRGDVSAVDEDNGADECGGWCGCRVVALYEGGGKYEEASRLSALRYGRREYGETYPVVSIIAGTVAPTLQYHGVWSFSLYRSISVRRGLHSGSTGTPMLARCCVRRRGSVVRSVYD